MGGGTDGNGSKNKFHHDAEVGKWGSGNSTGGGFGGNGGTLGDVSDIYINGNPSLDVTGYTFNGTTYSDLKDFAKAILESGTTEDVFYVKFNVNGESAPRTARIRTNGAANPGDDITIDYQYKLTYTVPSVGGTAGSTQEVFFYKRDGASINLPVLSDSVYTNQGGIDYHANKWDVQGQKVSGGNVRINATGDATISNITQVADTSYGFRSTDNALVVNQTSGTVAVNASGRSSITKIELPASGSVALDLSQVTNLAIANNGVTNNTNLTSIIFPESNFTLGEQVFRNCTNLSGSINLSHCTSLGRYAFQNCSGITSLTLGSNITSIPNWAFQNCSGLTGSVDLSHCTSIGQSAFNGCNGLTGTIDLSNCTSIGLYAFQNCSGFTSLTIGNGITSIPNWAFQNCSGLTGSVDLSHCTSIGQSAFNGCEELTGIVDLSRCISVGDYAFEKCGKLSGSINMQVCTSVGKFAFARCVNIDGVSLPQCTEIGEKAFRFCPKLTTINIPVCTSIGAWAFNTGDPDEQNPDRPWIDATHPGLSGALDLSSLETIDLAAFRMAKNITSVDLSDCKVIGDWAFSRCTGLTSVTLGSNLTSIGAGAFVYVPAVFTFAKDPTSFSYTNYVDAESGAVYSTFKNGVTATWNGNTYTWNASANSGNGAWE